MISNGIKNWISVIPNAYISCLEKSFAFNPFADMYNGVPTRIISPSFSIDIKEKSERRHLKKTISKYDWNKMNKQNKL